MEMGAKMPRSFTTVNTSTLVSESDNQPEAKYREMKESVTFTVKEQSVLIVICFKLLVN